MKNTEIIQRGNNDVLVRLQILILEKIKKGI
jgi:hypothetical protein